MLLGRNPTTIKEALQTIISLNEMTSATSAEVIFNLLHVAKFTVLSVSFSFHSIL